MPDRDLRNQMEQQSIECEFCDWNGIFKDYKVKYSCFMQFSFILIEMPFNRKENLYKTFCLREL